jgi:precorrin-3B synthase
MNAPPRRGTCPTLTAPLPTGDGLLVRLSPTATIALDSFAGLGAAVRRYGNGIVEVTTRGSIQVRGLTAASAPAFARAVATLGIEQNDRVPVIADPLAGVAPDAVLDANALAARLRDVLAATDLLASLHPKTSVAIDGGATLHLDTMTADVRLRADVGCEHARLHISVGGDAAAAAPLGWVAPEHAVETTMRLLAAVAARGRDVRARDVIGGEGAGPLQAAAGDLLIAAPPPPARGPAEPIGTHDLHGGFVAVGLGLALGHSDANALQQLVGVAQRVGARGIRTSPGRVLLIIGIPAVQAQKLIDAAERLGFIVHAQDPRRYVVACPGLPLCRSALAPTRALGPLVAKAAAPLLDGSLTVHLSGCAKGCAHARAAGLTLVGSAGTYGAVVNGSACDRPVGSIATDNIAGSLARLASEVERTRQRGECALGTLSRLGADHVSAILQEGGCA